MSFPQEIETPEFVEVKEPAEEPAPDAAGGGQWQQTRRFLEVAAVFVLPLLVVVGLPTLLLLLQGEVMPLGQVIRMQKNSDSMVLYGPAVSGPDGAFKLKSVLAREPRILAMGSSRVMAFRSKFFKDSEAFYNSGGSVSGFRHFRQFLENIPPGKEPKVIIMAFEQRYFNAVAGHFMRHDYQEWLHWEQDVPKILLQGIRDTYKKTLVEGQSVSSLLPAKPDGEPMSAGEIASALKSMNRIGMTALVKNNGYRNDGSYYYGSYVANPTSPSHWDYRFSDTLRRVEQGTSGFQWGSEVWAEALAEISILLPYCKKRGIDVVAFMPPFAPAVLEEMRRSGNFTYIDKIMPAAEPVFRKHGVNFFDFTDMRAFGSNDSETIDGWHASEKAYLRAFLIMARKDPVLRREVDIAELERRLAAAKTPYDVFGPDEY